MIKKIIPSLLCLAALTLLPVSASADWTLLEQHTITSSSAYQQRVEMAFLKTAFDVSNEDPQTANHAARLVLAEQVINGSGVPPRAFKLLHILNPALQGTQDPTDSDLLFTVSQQWNYFANQIAQ
jgi:predicted outer membrane protein